jgi:hypothetical protein
MEQVVTQQTTNLVQAYATLFGSIGTLSANPTSNPRSPDFIAIVHPGTIYTGGSKLAEHGGLALNDRNVALLISSPGIAPAVRADNVETRQVAPTILRALGLNANDLQSVRHETTRVLPGLSLR